MSWRETSLGEVLSVRHGKSQRAVESPSGRYPVLATGGRIGWSRVPLYSKPSVLIGRKGTIDRPQYQDSPFWTVDTLFYTELTKSVDPRFIYYIFQTIDWRSMNEASGVPSLSSSRIENIGVKLPSLDEQIIIREALDDADNLIVTLERLITKKQAIKTGMMQQLLTGRMRLPGFTKPWRQVTAGDLGIFKGGNGFPVRYQGNTSGKYPFYKVSDMNNVGNERVMQRANNYVSEAHRKSIGSSIIPARAIVLAKVGAAIFQERKRILSQPSCIDNNMAAFILDSSVADVDFVHAALSNFLLGSLVSTTALPSLNGGQLRSIPLSMPGSLEEQQAIARVLMDVDEELSTLSDRLGKVRDVKQGMMQQLLTGRTRLPVEAAA